MNVLPIGETITYTYIAPFTYEQEVVTAVIEGRNWDFENFGSYIVRGGECVYPDQIQE